MRPIYLLATMIILVLAACSSDSFRSLAGVPGLYPVVQRYYDSRATEENGRCRAPLLDGVMSSKVVQSDGQRLVVQVRYLYRDLTTDVGGGACRGFGNRTFTIAREPDGMKVISMTGAQHPPGLRLRLAN
jgi:hypothetical protein